MFKLLTDEYRIYPISVPLWVSWLMGQTTDLLNGWMASLVNI